jgi:hypothetical protein
LVPCKLFIFCRARIVNRRVVYTIRWERVSGNVEFRVGWLA